LAFHGLASVVNKKWQRQEEIMINDDVATEEARNRNI